MNNLEKYERLIDLDFFKNYLNVELGKILGDHINEFKNLKDLGMAHFSLGMHLRNTWNLWDNKNESDLVKFFHSIGIYHADDMSGICIDTYYLMLNSLDIDIEGQVAKYQEHWKKQGYKDGICKDA